MKGVREGVREEVEILSYLPHPIASSFPLVLLKLPSQRGNTPFAKQGMFGKFSYMS